MGNDKGNRVPQQGLADAYARGLAPGVKPPNFVFDRCECSNIARCGSARRFPNDAPLLFDVRGTGFGDPLKIILNELPEGGAAHSWSHCGVINQQMSDLASAGKPLEKRAPVHVWQSACPTCHRNGPLVEVDRRVAVLKAAEEQGRIKDGRPVACTTCGERRAGLSFDIMARFKDGPCMASVTLIEADPKGWDFRPGWDHMAQHWAFSGVLDRTRGDQAGIYRWAATCPKCVRVGMATVGQQPIIAPQAGKLIH